MCTPGMQVDSVIQNLDISLTSTPKFNTQNRTGHIFYLYTVTYQMTLGDDLRGRQRSRSGPKNFHCKRETTFFILCSLQFKRQPPLFFLLTLLSSSIPFLFFLFSLSPFLSPSLLLFVCLFICLYVNSPLNKQTCFHWTATLFSERGSKQTKRQHVNGLPPQMQCLYRKTKPGAHTDTWINTYTRYRTRLVGVGGRQANHQTTDTFFSPLTTCHYT